MRAYQSFYKVEGLVTTPDPSSKEGKKTKGRFMKMIGVPQGVLFLRYKLGFKKLLLRFHKNLDKAFWIL
jgi:hypothetical protein